MTNQHRFKVGQTVRFLASSPLGGDTRRGDTPEGIFRIVRLLPDHKGNNQYRIESAGDGHERVVMEHEITEQ